jgi:iron complex transport system substrate-binding protein
MLGDAFFGTPRHIVGFAYRAKWFNSDLFQDMDPAVLRQEYFDNFLRVEADVINKGKHY